MCVMSVCAYVRTFGKVLGPLVVILQHQIAIDSSLTIQSRERGRESRNSIKNDFDRNMDDDGDGNDIPSSDRQRANK